MPLRFTGLLTLAVVSLGYVLTTFAQKTDAQRGEAKDDNLPNLYVLAVGVSAYPVDAMKLNCAARDAEVLAKTFQTTSRSLYKEVEVKLLTDKQATRRNILQGLAWLRKQMTQRDVGVVSFSGHGDKDGDGRFYLLPVDVDEGDLLSTGVPSNQVKDVLAALPGRMLLLLDACHAGAAGDKKRRAGGALTDDLIRDLAAEDGGGRQGRGLIVMAAATGREFSLESSRAGHGFFTLALIEGLTGKADYNKDKDIDWRELDRYVTGRVKELSDGQQHPVTTKSGLRPFALSRPDKDALAAVLRAVPPETELKKSRRSIACREKWSGSMRVVGERRNIRHFTMAMRCQRRRRILTGTIRLAERTRGPICSGRSESVHISRMGMGCAICTGMCGSGVRTGITRRRIKLVNGLTLVVLRRALRV